MYKRLGSAAIIAVCIGTDAAWAANPLKQATFTQVVNRVQIIKGANQSSAARVGEVFRAPETLRTGASARCELKASDNTLTRIGSNTVFRFGQEPRTIFLEQGNVLFYSPTGKGGGTIKTASASAGVLGSTNMVSATSNGGFKVLGLEHRTKVKFNKIKGIFGAGKIRVLKPGQMTFVLPGATKLPPVFEFRLEALMKGSELLNGFPQQLPSLAAIQQNAVAQERQIAKGKKSATSKIIGDVNSDGQLGLIDANARQAFFVQQVEAATSEIFDVFGEDLILTSSEIPEDFVFLSPELVEGLSELGFSFADDSEDHDDKEIFSNLGLVAARNIIFRTGTVNLSPFSSVNAVGFFASENIQIEQSVIFEGFTGALGLYAADSITIDPGLMVQYDGELFLLASINELSLSGSSIYNLEGDIQFDSQGNISFTDMMVYSGNEIFFRSEEAISITGSELIGHQTVEFEAVNDINIIDSIIEVFDLNTVSEDYADIFIDSQSGNINITNSEFPYGGADTMVAENGSFYLEALNGAINLTGPAGGMFMDIPAMDISMAARTIALDHVSFPSGAIIKFYSQLGIYNFGANVMPGYINLNSVFYGGVSIQAEIPLAEGGTNTGPSNVSSGTLNEFLNGQ